MSRNEREGRYIGKVLGHHQRIHGATRKNERDELIYCDNKECEQEGATVRSWCVWTGTGHHWEYGAHWIGDYNSICLCCGKKSGYDDSSI